MVSIKELYSDIVTGLHAEPPVKTMELKPRKNNTASALSTNGNGHNGNGRNGVDHDDSFFDM